MNKYIIQNLSKNDISEIIEIQKELGIHIVSEKSLIEDLNIENYNYFALKTNNSKTKLIGFVGISKIFDSMDLLSIVIAKEFQKLGYGNVLLNHIINLAKENNISTIMLEVRESNFPAQRLYEKNGFKLINKRKNYYSDNKENALIYTLKID